MPEDITSRENDSVKYAVKLTEKPAFCKAQNRFIAEGYKLCMEAAAADVKIEIIYYTLAAKNSFPDIVDLPGKHISISDNVATKISGSKTPQGIFAVCHTPVFTEDNLSENGKYIVLENLQDPVNIGAIMRSAAAFGFSGIVATTSCAYPYSLKVLRGSMGAAFKLPMIYTEDLTITLEMLSQMGILTIAAALDGATFLDKSKKPSGGVAICIGNEGSGLTKHTVNACNKIIKIPISDKTESLNAAVAASILMWEYGGD